MNAQDGMFFEEFHSMFPSVNQEMVNEAEFRLGFKIPESYLQVLKIQNGGLLRKRYFVVEGKTLGWVYMLFGIGDHEMAIDQLEENEETTNQLLIRNWGYPETGIVICQQGHEGYFLDYSECGNHGEPKVLHVLSEYYPKIVITKIAPTFSSFLAGLSEVDPSEDDSVKS